jgi:hypothetical protein
VAAGVTQPNYIKLPGKARTLATTSRLWLGEDHILLVKSTRVVEDYRRFYFPDVQAILVRRTMPFHYGWAAFLFISTLLVARFWRSVPATLIMLAASGVYLRLRGPACVCHLYTAVRRERLPSVHRWKTAERVLEILRSHIEQHQGAVVSIPDTLPTSDPPPLAGPPPLPSAFLQPGSVMPHFALFSTLLISSMIAGSRAAVPIAALIEFLFFVPVLVWQTARRFSKELKTLTWVAIARWALVQSPAWIVQYKAAIVDKTTREVTPWTVPLGYGWIGWLNFISLLLIGMVGVWFTIADARAISYSAESNN